MKDYKEEELDEEEYYYYTTVPHIRPQREFYKKNDEDSCNNSNSNWNFTKTLKERMYQKNLSIRKTAKLLNISTSDFNKILSGQKEPSMKIARLIHKYLDIDAKIILGV